MSGYDLLVIGGGTAGLVSAAGAAMLGAKVALVERDKLGGDCTYYGCVPTKALIKSAKVASLMRRAPEFGIEPVSVEVDFPAVMARMRGAIERAAEADSPERFRGFGVEVILGEEARFVSPREASVGGRRLSFRSVVVATGSHSVTPPVDGIEEAGYITHVGALELEKLPESLAVVGSGPIGCEFAQMFSRLGSCVEVLDSVPLPEEDAEVSAALHGFLEDEGVRFHGGFWAEAVRVEGGEKVISARDSSGEEIEVRAEEILIAAGRAPSVDGLGLENAGVELGKNGVKVDGYLRTNAGNIYAAGDVIGGPLFTHAAYHQARTALRNALFPIKSEIDYSALPWTTFTDPEVARVGLTEREARERHRSVGVYRFPFSDLDRAICDGETNGFVKLVTDRRGKILGGHIIGPDAGNYIGEVVLAMRKNIPIGELSQTVHVYPTLSESVKNAADGYYRERLFTRRNRRVLGALFALRRRFF